MEHYDLDAILAVGSVFAAIRACRSIGRLKEYLVKGFTMDDERLKNPPGKRQEDYFTSN